MISNDSYPSAEIAALPRSQLFVCLNKRRLCHFCGILFVMHQTHGSTVNLHRVALH